MTSLDSIVVAKMRITEALQTTSQPGAIYNLRSDYAALTAFEAELRTGDELSVEKQGLLMSLLKKCHPPPSVVQDKRWSVPEVASTFRGSGQTNMPLAPPVMRTPLLKPSYSVDIESSDDDSTSGSLWKSHPGSSQVDGSKVKRQRVEDIKKEFDVKMRILSDSIEQSTDIETLVLKDRQERLIYYMGNLERSGFPDNSVVHFKNMMDTITEPPTKKEVDRLIHNHVEKQVGGIEEWIEKDQAAALLQAAAKSSSKTQQPVTQPRTQEEAEKKAAKKHRQKMKKDLSTLIGREPTEEELKTFMKGKALTVEEKASGSSQTKRAATEMVGFKVPVAKASSSLRNSSPGSPQVEGSNDKNDADGAVDMDAEPKSVLTCKFFEECKATNLKRSGFLLDDADASWMGNLWGVCFVCSDFTNEKEFERACKKRWEARSRLMRGRRSRVREITFANCHKVLTKLFEDTGVQSKVIRGLAIMRAKTIGAASAAAFDEMNKHHKDVSFEINRMYQQELERAAADPSVATKMQCQRITATEASYLTEVYRGVSCSFICRYPDCLFFGQNDGLTWPEQRDRYHFRCPSCAREASPWTCKKGQIAKLAYVLMMVDPHTTEIVHIPCEWPPSEEQNWLNRQIEATALNIKTMEDVVKWREGAKEDLSKLLNRQRVSEHFKQYPWKSENEHMMTKYNFAPIKERGYYVGAHLNRSVAEGPLYNNWTEFIGMYANYVASTRVAIATSNL